MENGGMESENEITQYTGSMDNMVVDNVKEEQMAGYILK